MSSEQMLDRIERETTIAAPQSKVWDPELNAARHYLEGVQQ